ncbi:peptidoglycan recognition protein 5 [Cyclopterus lumpus]|uniref:Peptidoglycan recognition protein 5 n=1 Tax=Cyclopterus lumpus TaxID=8103 RepID=A0A8C2ZE28_CYCLU|nr:peptidoglycan recognition protein 5 [Cyclopterus lumpus]
MWNIDCRLHFLLFQLRIFHKTPLGTRLLLGQHDQLAHNLCADTSTWKTEEGVLPVTTPPETGSFIRRQSSPLHSKSPVYGDMAQTVNIVSRQQWEAAAPKSKETLTGSAKRAVIHHTALPRCKDEKECKSRIASIQRNHMTERGFDDIGYNFLVGEDGSVYEGRGWGVVGAHAKGNNDDSVGIAFMGDFNVGTPSTEAMSSVKLLLQSGVCEGFLIPKFTVVGHRDLGQTECPGGKLYAALAQLKGCP